MRISPCRETREDEALNGLDPVEADRIRRFLRARRGRQTIVVSSHNLNDIEALCTHVTFVENGRVAKTVLTEAITRTVGRVTFTLAARPQDMEALSAAVPGVSFEWSDADRSLACTFGEDAGGVADVNRMLLPALLAQTDVVAVTPGQSLERAYLGMRPQD